MAAISLAKQAVSALKSEKPHSSITDWVEILTSDNYEDEAYDGIPELVDSINLQPTGPAEASRAIRKKLKHGTIHQQYRAIVLLKATVENGGPKFQTTFADGQLTDAIKHMASDPSTDSRVKRKLASTLLAWHKQFQGEPRMTLVANLYKCLPENMNRKATEAQHFNFVNVTDREAELEKREKEKREAKAAKDEAKRKAKEEKEERKRRKEEEQRQAANPVRRRAPFDIEKERPQVLNSIAEASQASSNLVNALTLVNTDHERVQESVRVQDCLEKAKLVRKRLVRYIQLVEDEELIGTLLEINERIIDALQFYDVMAAPKEERKDVAEVTKAMAAADISSSEVNKLQEKQRVQIERSISRRTRDRPSVSQDGSAYVHPDLQDLSFGNLSSDHQNLPPPLRPTSPRSGGDDDEDDYGRGSLSDYSDYASSDEDAHKQWASSSKQASHGTDYRRSSHDEVDVRQDTHRKLLNDVDDPFADPFADQEEGVGTPGIPQKTLKW